ncbi:MAG: L-threonylcarbamoyladenylate synthase [Patescibacteria group bacterium]
MKKIWFKRKKYGWGWTFGTWESYAVLALYVLLLVYIFRLVDLGSHSGSDTLLNFAPRFLLLTTALYLLCWLKGEKPEWSSLRKTQDKWGEEKKGLRDILRGGGVAVIPTDTTYGIVGSALNERTVNEIYRLRKRDLNKPFIVLIADKKDLKKFGVIPTEAQEKILRKVWPGPVSVILPCNSERFAYLHRGKNSLAFRVPVRHELQSLLGDAGPLVAPSANPQGHLVAKNISEARAYFGHHVDFYQDGGEVTASPSRLIDITDDTEKVLRA